MVGLHHPFYPVSSCHWHERFHNFYNAPGLKIVCIGNILNILTQDITLFWVSITGVCTSTDSIFFSTLHMSRGREKQCITRIFIWYSSLQGTAYTLLRGDIKIILTGALYSQSNCSFDSKSQTRLGTALTKMIDVLLACT